MWYSDASGPSRYRLQIKIHDFENPRWRRPPSSKMEKSLYIRIRLTDFDKIWQADASRPSGPQEPIKFRDFKKTKMAVSAILKI